MANAVQQRRVQAEIGTTSEPDMAALLDPVHSSQQFLNSFGFDNALLTMQELMHRQEEIDIPDVSDEINAATVAQLMAKLMGPVEMPRTLPDRITQHLVTKGDDPTLSDEHLFDAIVQAEMELDVDDNERIEEEHDIPPSRRVRIASTLTRKQIRHQERVANCILSNKRSIITKIVLGTLGLVAAYGIFSSLVSFGLVSGAMSAASGAASGFGYGAFPAWFSAFYATLRKLGMDKAIISRIFLLAQQNETLRRMGTLKPVDVSPRLLRIMKRYHVPAAFLEASVSSLTEKLVTEGLALTSAGGVASYALTTGISSTIAYAPGAAQATRDAAIQCIGKMRKLVTRKGLDDTAQTMVKTSSVFATVQAVAQQLDPAPNTVRRTVVSRPIRTTISAKTVAEQAARDMSTVNRALQTAGVAGSALALGLYQGQILEMATSAAQNSFVRSTAMSYLVQYTGLPRLVSKYGAVLTTGALSQLTDLSRPLQDPKTKPHEKNVLMQSFFAILLGKQVYSDEQIQRMTLDELKSVFKDQQIATKAQPTGSLASSASAWRKALLRVQQDRLVITKQELIASMTSHILTTATTAVLVDVGQTYADTIMDSFNLKAITDLAGVTENEIAAAQVAASDPEFVRNHLQANINYTKTAAGATDNVVHQNAVRGIEKINSLLERNPMLAAEMSTRLDEPSPFVRFPAAAAPSQPVSRLQDAPQPASFQQPQSRLEDAPVPVALVGEVTDTSAYNTEIRAQLRAVRAERQAQAKVLSEAHFEATVQKFATRFGLSAAQIAGIQTKQQLQRAIEQAQTSITTPGIGVRAVELGSLTQDQLIDKTVLENARKIEFDPLYYQVRDAAIHAGSSWIPGVGAVIEKTNLGIAALNASKNTWNLSVAFNQMMGYSEFVKEHAGFMPFADIPKIQGVADAIIDQLGTKAPKVNVGEVFLQATIRKIQEQWTTTQFISEIAQQVLGKEAAKADMDKLMAMLSKAPSS